MTNTKSAILNLTLIAVILITGAGCGFLTKADRVGEKVTPLAPTNTTAATTEAPSAPKTDASALTVEKFDRLKNGMSYAEVKAIIGQEGTQNSSSESGRYKIESYKWEGADYARIYATFRNDKLISKSQSKLEGPGSPAPASADLSMDKFNNINTGMSYEEVVKILGSEGTQTRSSQAGKYKSESYKWEGDGYKRVFATFRNGKLTTKSQTRLQ